jgi:hypothetical protein
MEDAIIAGYCLSSASHSWFIFTESIIECATNECLSWTGMNWWEASTEASCWET